MNEKLTKAWIKGCNSGNEMVLEFLKEVKNIDFEKEFKLWCNCDSFINWKGEKIDRCGDADHELNAEDKN